MSNLRLLNETTVSSSVASVNVTDVFTNDFDIYKIVLSDTVSDTNTSDLDMRFINSSGSVISSSDYQYAWLRVRSDSSFNENRSTGDSDIQVGFGQVNAALSNGVVGYVFNPFSASSYTFYLMQSGNMSGTNFRAIKQIAVLKQLSSIAGVQLVVNGGNLTGAKIRTYGLRVDT
jgi:hypothetical protein